MVASLAGELWRRDPTRPLNIFNPEVDDSGFDLVLGCVTKLRYIQVKQVHAYGAASKFSVRARLLQDGPSALLANFGRAWARADFLASSQPDFEL